MIYTQDKVNLHTHSFYCIHGTGRISEYVSEAEKAGLQVLGFSEHVPLPDREYRKGDRMTYPQLPLYEKDVLEARRTSGMQILLGMECDWLPDEASYYRDELAGSRGYDFLIGAVHHMPNPATGVEKYLGRIADLPVKTLMDYVDIYNEGIASGLFIFCAHPDLVFAAYRDWDSNAVSASRDIIRCAKQYDMPLEINGYGLVKPPVETPQGPRPMYPVRRFWEMALEEGVRVVANSDAHRPEDVGRNMLGAMSFAASMGIKLCSYEIDLNSKTRVKVL